jgi:hypothetical protein
VHYGRAVTVASRLQQCFFYSKTNQEIDVKYFQVMICIALTMLALAYLYGPAAGMIPLIAVWFCGLWATFRHSIAIGCMALIIPPLGFTGLVMDWVVDEKGR